MIRIYLILSLFVISANAADTLTVNSNKTKTAVVELYTSEGCSSCPPADQWFEALVELPSDEVDVLALAFHVDYWDYLGWKDRFASPKFTNRQLQLGSNNKQRTIYTPEFFVNGKEARGTLNVLDQIRENNRMPAPVSLTLSVAKSANKFDLKLQSLSTNSVSQTLHHRFIVYENHLKTDVKRGENAGKLLKHQQVVRFMSPALSLKSSNEYQVPIDPTWQLGNVGIAVIVTSAGNDSYQQAVYTSVTALLSP